MSADRALDLVCAVSGRDRERIRALLHAGDVHIDELTPNGVVSPLLKAVVEGDYGMVEFLISLGADVNRPEASGRFPLLVAIEQHRSEITLLLIRSGADVHSRIGSRTMLDIACAFGWRGIAELLRRLGI